MCIFPGDTTYGPGTAALVPHALSIAHVQHLLHLQRTSPRRGALGHDLVFRPARPAPGAGKQTLPI